MQLGARWQVGQTPHRSVPETLHSGIAREEAAHPTAVAWTLTWLEGRPRCALDDLLVLSLDADGTVCTESMRNDSLRQAGTELDDEDDWLS